MGKSSASLALPLAPPSTLARMLTPSLADILFIAVITWSFLAAGGWSSLLMDGDTGFHIRVGDWIRDQGRLPVTHPFSFSVTGREWYAFEWLSQVALSWLNSSWGLLGVALASGFLIGAVFTVLFRFAVWRGANPLIAAMVVLLAANTARIHFWARPHLITWMCLVIAIWLVERERRGATRWTWCLVPLTVLWANSHGGFILFYVLLAIQIAALSAEAKWGQAGWSLVRRLSLIGFVSFTAALINPYGIGLLSHIFEVVSAGWLRTAVDEFKSPSFRSEPLMVFMGLLFVSLALCWRLVEKRQFVEVAWILFLAYSSLTAVRQVPIFAIVVAPILAVELSELWAVLLKRCHPKSVARILDDVAARFGEGANRTGLIPVLFGIAVVFVSAYACPVAFPAKLFPTALVEAHANQLASARVFTTDQWSDYLIYRNYPAQRSFIDGQHQYYGENHVNEYLTMLEGRPDWAAVMRRFDFDYALCPRTSPLVSMLNADAGWKLVDTGQDALLYARVTP